MEPNFIEYLTANEHIAYPFGEDAAALVDTWNEVVVTTPPTAPKDFLSDAVILLPADYAGYMYLHSITAASLDDYDFVIKDESGATVISFSVNIAAPAPVTHSVIQEITVTDPIYAVRLLTGPSFVQYLTKIGADLGVSGTVTFGTRLPFETSAVEFRPARVTSVVFTDSLTDIEHTLDEVVGLYEGNNIEFDVTPQSVEIIAGPGLGQGVTEEGCVDPKPSWYETITSLQGAQPDEDGNINIKGEPCHRIVPDPAGHRILIYNDCEPCCLCEDYANFTVALKKYFERLELVWQGNFYPVAAYRNFTQLVQTMNVQIAEYNSSIYPKIRTFTFWPQLVLGSKSPEIRGTVQSIALATLTIVLTNRSDKRITVDAGISWSSGVVLLKYSAQGKEGAVLTADTFTTSMDPFTELHFYWLVRADGTNFLSGLSATITARWMENGGIRELTRTASDIGV